MFILLYNAKNLRFFLIFFPQLNRVFSFEPEKRVQSATLLIFFLNSNRAIDQTIDVQFMVILVNSLVLSILSTCDYNGVVMS